MELLELIESAEDELGLGLAFPQEPHHVRLWGEDNLSTLTVYIHRQTGTLT